MIGRAFSSRPAIQPRNPDPRATTSSRVANAENAAPPPAPLAAWVTQASKELVGGSSGVRSQWERKEKPAFCAFATA